MAKQIICDVTFAADGSVDETVTRNSFNALLARLVSSVKEDFDSVSVEITAFLLENPALKTIPTSALVRALWERKVEAGLLKGKSQEEKSIMYARLEEVVPEYVKSNTDMFHMGRKTGIAIHFVPGETVKDANGNVTYDKGGNEVQAYRHTSEEWAKLTTPKAKDGANTAAAAQ